MGGGDVGADDGVLLHEGLSIRRERVRAEGGIFEDKLCEDVVVDDHTREDRDPQKHALHDLCSSQNRWVRRRQHSGQKKGWKGYRSSGDEK